MDKIIHQKEEQKMKRILMIFMFLIFIYCLTGCETQTKTDGQGSNNDINEAAKGIESIEKTKTRITEKAAKVRKTVWAHIKSFEEERY